MENIINSIQNKALQGLANLAGGQITGAVKAAADKTGVDFAYLMQQAGAESSFDADAKAKTSSATGLFQFIESTWMSMVERYGDQHGIDSEASKGELLALRSDPAVASSMAAELASENKGVLDAKWGGTVGSTELYFAHFLGAGSASAFMNARDAGGSDPAAVLFPKAAAANQNVFYDRATGQPKSLDEVYAFFDKKFGIEDGAVAPSVVKVAEAVEIPKHTAQATFTHTPDHDRMAELGAFRDSSSATPNRSNNLASYQSLIMNQMDLILLTQQLDLPLMGGRSNNKLL